MNLKMEDVSKMAGHTQNDVIDIEENEIMAEHYLVPPGQYFYSEQIYPKGTSILRDVENWRRKHTVKSFDLKRLLIKKGIS